MFRILLKYAIQPTQIFLKAYVGFSSFKGLRKTSEKNNECVIQHV